MTQAWVIGGGGLLGKSLVEHLRSRGRRLYSPRSALNWADGDQLKLQIEEAIEQFAVSLKTGERWEICWAAGVGTMNSTEAAMAPECRALGYLLDMLATHPAFGACDGSFMLASSAGAIYAGSGENIIDESTPPIPTTAYGRAKLALEQRARALSACLPTASVLIARITTLYGPGQSTRKAQGLLSHIARQALRNQVIHVYVPLDTIRDYIYVADAATVVVNLLDRLALRRESLTKIIASEDAITIAQIIAAFKRVLGRPPRLVTSVSRATQVYNRRILFRSVVANDGPTLQKTNLVLGIAALLAEERMNFSRGGR